MHDLSVIVTLAGATIVATAGSSAGRAWRLEFGAAFVCDALDEMSGVLLRAVRSGL